MSRPVLVKLGGAVLTGKKEGSGFQKPAARRLLSEIRKADVPAVVLHGAGSFGHPEAIRHRIGQVRLVGKGAAQAVSETLAAVGLLHAQVVFVAAAVGLKPLSVSLEGVRSEGGILQELPIGRVAQAIADGYTPMLHGTVVRDDRLGWRVASADELMAVLAAELQPRLALYATDVDGVFDGDPHALGAAPLPKICRDDLRRLTGETETADDGGDATGAMAGKLVRALQAAESAPTLIVSGLVRNRVLDAIKGKAVIGTRVEAG